MADRFRTFRAQIQIDLAYVGKGPVLVRSGGASPPERPDMAFVRYPTVAGDAPFLPGSSLKGVLRSGIEQVLRGQGRNVCDPFKSSCGRNKDGLRCEACLLFGSTRGAGVLAVDDALPWRPEDPLDQQRRKLDEIERGLVVRHGVGIDRTTGTAARGVLYDFEALVEPTFYGSLRLRNPSVDQLALVAVGLQMLRDDLLRVGGMTTRGLGRIRPLARRVTLRAPNPEAAEPFLAGGAFAAPVASGLVHEWVAGGPEADIRERTQAARRLLDDWAGRATRQEVQP